MLDRRCTLAAIIALVIAVGPLLSTPAQAELTGMPDGFVDQPVVGGVPAPTAIDWLPDGTLLIATQSGILFSSSDKGLAQVVLDLSGDVCYGGEIGYGGELGLLGLAVDPEFSSGRRFVYLYYTQRRGPDCGVLDNEGDRINRVARFTVKIDGTIDIGSEWVLIDSISARGGAHAAGDLQFDRSGLLYVSVGDAGEDIQTGQREPNNTNAQRLDLLNGKILRITRDGDIPFGNPFQDSETTTRCNGAGRDPSGKGLTCQEIFATGLRNPFRIAFDADDKDANQRFYINDVGGVAWDEVDHGEAGVDYGWPAREGPCPFGVTSGNCTPDPQFVEPVFAYRRDGLPAMFAGCSTITGGAFVLAAANWPSLYDEAYIFADAACARLFVLKDEAPGAALEVFAAWNDGPGTGAIHLAFGPDHALYYTTFADGGQVRMIAFRS